MHRWCSHMSLHFLCALYIYSLFLPTWSTDMMRSPSFREEHTAANTKTLYIRRATKIALDRRTKHTVTVPNVVIIEFRELLHEFKLVLHNLGVCVYAPCIIR
ncbi:hypothetical protein J3A83DRAFT_474503 [Scleroderma citrinum]